jgi:YidC/Oxa1 family membrane protein insertase
MEKRFLIALVLSFLVLTIWSKWVSKAYHIENKQVASQQEQVIPRPSITSTTPPLPEPMKEEFLPTIQYKQDNLEAGFLEPIAAIREVIFKSYQNDKFVLQAAFLYGDRNLTFQKAEEKDNSISFTHRDVEKTITKKFLFDKSNYTIELEIEIENISDKNISISSPLILGILDFSSRNIDSRYQSVAIATKDKTSHLNALKNIDIPEVTFLSIRNKYYCLILEPEQKNYSAFIRKINNQASEIGLALNSQVIQIGQKIKQKFHVYLGPQDLKLIQKANSTWSSTIYYGTFDFIAQSLLQLLGFFYNLTKNWGWAIVMLSLAIYIILFPLTLKQMRSVKEMQVLQPKVEALRQAYKDNPQRLNKEIMELYKEHKVNPLGGCLPLLLQMPIFFALYQALMRSVALKGARFLWIKDLSKPDQLFTLPFPAPFNYFNILPILMMIGMFIQQKISSVSSTSNAAAEQQKIMMFFMPILFGFIFYNMPAGLVLYWFINSTLMLFNQFRMQRIR